MTNERDIAEIMKSAWDRITSENTVPVTVARMPAEEVAALLDEIAALKADAERMRWLLDGNGYFMEYEMLCGHGPCTEEDKNAARAVIDAAMKNGV